MEPFRLNVVVYEDDTQWVAQAIEVDIEARADSLSKLPRAFERAVIANLAVNRELGRSALESIGPAPSQFQALFETALFGLSARVGAIAAPAGFEIGDLRLAEVA